MTQQFRILLILWKEGEGKLWDCGFTAVFRGLWQCQSDGLLFEVRLCEVLNIKSWPHPQQMMAVLLFLWRLSKQRGWADWDPLCVIHLLLPGTHHTLNKGMVRPFNYQKTRGSRKKCFYSNRWHNFPHPLGIHQSVCWKHCVLAYFFSCGSNSAEI